MEKALAVKSMKKQDLAAECGVSASYITKILKTHFIPDEDRVRAIGRVLGDSTGALQAAGYAQPSARLPGSGHAISLLRAFMEWLTLEGIHTKDQSDFLSQCFEESLAQCELLKDVRRELHSRLDDQLGMKLRSIFGNETPESRSLDPISEEVQMFIRNMPKVQFPLKRVRNEVLLPALLSGMFTTDEDLLHLQLNAPLLLTPITLLRITGDPKWLSEQNKKILDIKALKELEVGKTLATAHERFAHLPASERHAIWSLAKSLVNSLADLLDMRFDLLSTPYDYYDVKHIYAPGQEVFVFATTSGLVIPLEFRGDESRQKNTYRYSYFTDGILHGLQSGCHVRYQFDTSSTSTGLKDDWKKADNKPKFEEDAARILATFMMEPNIEITSGTFSPMDERRWLTLSSERWVVISARDKASKKLVHGLLIDSSYFNKILDMVPAPRLMELPNKLNEKDQTREVIKPMETEMDQEEAKRQSMMIIKRLLSK